jgi:2-phosphosulfolactate phosphatase
MPQIEVCLTPDLLSHHQLTDKSVVVIDIFRATSCMVTALANGVKGIIPVAEVAECKALQKEGYLAAAERKGVKAEGFDLDNSPFSYLNPELAGKTIAMTTSNGTSAITAAKSAKEVLIGAFLNKTALVEYLKQQHNDVVLICAGWKGRVNLEDAFFAGAMLADMLYDFKFADDDCILARSVYHVGQHNPKRFLESASHYARLETLGSDQDIDFCLQIDKYNIVPKLFGRELAKMEV